LPECRDVKERRNRFNNSPLKNGLVRRREVVPNFAEASLANRQLKKPGMAFSTD